MRRNRAERQRKLAQAKRTWGNAEEHRNIGHGAKDKGTLRDERFAHAMIDDSE